MLAIIDNYDSFTFNLISYLGTLGVDFRIFRNDEIIPNELVTLKPDGILISPGPSNPENAGYSVAIVKEFAGKVPILGVCLGHQIIAHAFGGVVSRAPIPMHGKISVVNHLGIGVFKGLPSPMKVTRYHSLMVKEVPTDFIVTAHAEDNVIMALQHKVWPVFGVQFHPEAVLTQCGIELLANFVEIMEQ